MHKFGGREITSAIVRFYLIYYFRYFLLCATLGEGELYWSCIGSSVAYRNHSFYQRLRFLGVDLCLWMGNNGVVLSMVK
jgi:hypothetical protein